MSCSPPRGRGPASSEGGTGASRVSEPYEADAGIVARAAREEHAVGHVNANQPVESLPFDWVRLQTPDAEELAHVGATYGIHALAAEDAATGRQRPKVERFGDDVACVIRAVAPDGGSERLAFGDIHVYTTPTATVVVERDGAPSTERATRRLASDTGLADMGSLAGLYAVVDLVVDGYEPVVDELESHVDALEEQIFAESPGADVVRVIYGLHRRAVALERAVQPVPSMLDDLRDLMDDDGHPVELRRLFRDVRDHAIRADGRVRALRDLIDHALSTHLALVAQRQSESSLRQADQAKKVSAWAAILFTPSLVGAIYGMNFVGMPELHWRFGYAYALTLMLVLGAGLWAAFKRARWL